MNESHRSNRDLTNEACEWAAAIAMNEISELERSRFKSWLNKSPDHAAAYRETCAAFDDPMIAAAMAQVANDDSSIENSTLDQPPIPISTSWISRASAASTGALVSALAASVLVVMWGLSLLQITPPGHKPNQIVTTEYATTGTEIREFTLPDGSVAMLGARSSVAVTITPDERRVTLLKGEGYFEVAPNPTHPFIVYAGDTTVRAVGTAFDVRLAVDSVRVDVVEGKVRVQSPSPEVAALDVSNQPESTMTASAGERLIFEPNGGLTKRPTTSGTELAAWRVGRLEYFGEELSTIVSDANRYYDGQIKIISNNIEAMNVTASFPTSSIEHIFELLAQQVPISVQKTEQGDILLSESKN